MGYYFLRGGGGTKGFPMSKSQKYFVLFIIELVKTKFRVKCWGEWSKNVKISWVWGEVTIAIKGYLNFVGSK